MLRKLLLAITWCLIIITAVGCNEKNDGNPNQKTPLSAVSRSFIKDAPVYRSIDEMTADADYIFRGILTKVESVEDASWQWEIYTVEEFYKGNKDLQEIRIISEDTYLKNGEINQREIGAEYYIFATAYETTLYPYPIILPIYNQAIFKVQENGQLSLANITDKDYFPAVFEDQFISNPQKSIVESPNRLNAKEILQVADRYKDIQDMLTNSDLVVRVVFNEVEKSNQYVSLGWIKEIKEYQKVNATVSLPTTIAFNEEMVAGEEYIVFLKLDPSGTAFRLSAREGSIIRPSDKTKWNEALAVFK